MTGSSANSGIQPSDCERCIRSLKAWLDEELGPGDSRAVGEHISSCSRCAAAAADYRGIAAAIAGAAAAPVPVPGVSSIVQRARFEDEEEMRMVRFFQRVASMAALLLFSSVGIYCLAEWADSSATNKGDTLDNVLELAISDPTWSEDL